MRLLRLVLLLALASVAPAWGACTSLSATNLVFGTYTGASALSVTATITVNCTSGYAYKLGLGTGYSGTTSARYLQSTPQVTNLNYGMFQDASHGVNWGNNSGVDTVSGTGTGSNQTYTIYGLMPAGQNMVPGSYADYPTAYIQGGSYVNLSNTASVPSNCTISASSLSFGTYQSNMVYGNASLSVNCTDSTTYNIGLSAGTAPGATVTSRAMQGTGSNILPYQLFQSNAYSTNWGNTAGTDTVTGTGTGSSQVVTVYGQILAGLYVTPGTYSDTISVTLTY